ncbi:ATP-binding protein [Paenibacillus sp. MER TA 81-3]|uniref:sensor histidine kinase n=1 Tax=Paenibacillus sp. MER TA 81-3 TaxID=2939573 RepID=UPI0020416686|nr:ATP-binding protein [Paenibacillus sp. MER TA 81-3]MCM3339272.1 ATP-binding protein [Paenibacillus sp. MER TA 81-3]
MNKPWYKSIRWKLLFTFALSIVLTLGSLALLVGMASLVYTEMRIPLINSLIRFTASNLGVVPSLVIAGLALFILIYFLLNRRLIKNVEKITETVQHIADGNLDAQCDIVSNDELGRLADNINMMTRRLKQSMEEERQAERTKNELVTSVSHDLRTPLTSIIGYLGLVEQDRYRDEVELRHYTNIAYEKAQRLNVMINDLFEYTRMNGGMALRMKPLNVAEMAGQLCVHYRYPMEQAGLSIRMNSQADQYWVEADPDKLVRVFDNLLTNAMSYAQPGTLVEIGLRRSGNRVAITVNSCGEPIPEQDLPYIFDRFYRVEKSRSEETGGSGLGLAISKTIVELHGGTITAASDMESTRFTIELPCIASPSGTG